MGIHNHWRNKQLGKNLITQEILCWEFLNKHPNQTWQWLGNKGYFYDYCHSFLKIDSHGQGLIMINNLFRLTPANMIACLDRLMHDNIQTAYLAINRFEIHAKNDLSLDYPDSMQKSIDLIVSQCQKKFKRLYDPIEVDARHFVGVHGLDVFVYENN